MKVLCTARACGKTHDAMEEFLRHSKSIFVVATEIERKRIIEQYKIQPLDHARICTVSKLKSEVFPSTTEVIVDNIELCFQAMFPWFRFRMGTVSGLHKSGAPANPNLSDEYLERLKKVPSREFEGKWEEDK